VPFTVDPNQVSICAGKLGQVQAPPRAAYGSLAAFTVHTTVKRNYYFF
jgi:hypothetical protein